jgi:hypothetical protein
MLLLACAGAVPNQRPAAVSLATSAISPPPHSNFFLNALSAASGRVLFSPILLHAAPFALALSVGDAAGPLARNQPFAALVLTTDGLLRVYELGGEDANQRRLIIQTSVRGMLSAATRTAMHPKLATTAATETSLTARSALIGWAVQDKAPSNASDGAGAARIVGVSLTVAHNPRIELSNAQSFIFQRDVQAWTLVDDGIGLHGAGSSAAFAASEMHSGLRALDRTAAQEQASMSSTSTLSSKSNMQPQQSLFSPSFTAVASIDGRTRIMQTLGQLEVSRTRALSVLTSARL